MEPEDSLPHLQVPATCPYPETDQFSPCHPYPFSWSSSLFRPNLSHCKIKFFSRKINL